MAFYPSWRYHRTERAQIVNDPEHELEIAHPENGWADTPAAFTLDDGPLDPGDDETLNATGAPDTWQPPAGMDEAREETPEVTAPAKPKRKR